MFKKHTSLKERFLGATLLVALTVFLSFGHILLSPSVAFANDKVHKDEVPHAPDAEEHSPCPTELHLTISNRATSDDDQNSIPKIDYFPVTFYSNSTCLEDHLISSYFFPIEKLPPRLPQHQKTNLLI